jgi:hypothetical protein
VSDLNRRLERLETREEAAQAGFRPLTPEEWHAVYAAERAFVGASEAGRHETALEEAEAASCEMLDDPERARHEGRGEAALHEAEEADATFQRTLGWRPDIAPLDAREVDSSRW